MATSPQYPSPEVRVLRSDWAELKEDWVRIASESPRATVFQTWEWVEPFFRHGLQPGEPLLLRIARGDRVIGIAPFVRVGGGRRLKRLLLLGGDYCDVLASPGEEEHVVRGLTSWLRQNRDEWQLADVRSLHESAVLRLLPDDCGLMVKRIRHQVYPALSLPSTYDEFEAGLSKGFRQELRYLPRRLQRDHPSTELRTAGSENLEEQMRELFRLHGKRWESRGMGGVFAGERPRALHLDVARGFLERDALRLTSLWIEGKAIASLYCLVQGSEVVYYISGFDPAFSSYSPVKILLADAAKRAIFDGLRTLDFLKGEEDYKSRWGAGSRWTERIVLGPRGVRSWFVMTGLSLQPMVKEWRRKRRQRNSK